jgi:NTE family protein
MKIGLILGGGGEVGIAWEIGVLAALEKEAGFKASTSRVIAGTSAGAIVGAYVAQGRSANDLVKLELAGQGVPVGAGFGGAAATLPNIPQDIIVALMSTDGTLEERGARLGRLALQAKVGLDEKTFVGGFREMVGTDAWPQVDFRPTAVNTETGATTLWDSRSGIALDAAVASSCSVPGIFPPVGFGGHHYIDVPRRPFAADLIKSGSLDAVIFIGLILPILANNNDQRTELERAAGSRLRTASITGGPGIAAISANLLDHSARARAVQVGLEDGGHAAAAVKALLR